MKDSGFEVMDSPTTLHLAEDLESRSSAGTLAKSDCKFRVLVTGYRMSGSAGGVILHENISRL